MPERDDAESKRTISPTLEYICNMWTIDLERFILC
jgi:hypothetical protein